MSLRVGCLCIAEKIGRQRAKCSVSLVEIILAITETVVAVRDTLDHERSCERGRSDMDRLADLGSATGLIHGEPTDLEVGDVLVDGGDGLEHGARYFPCPAARAPRLSCRRSAAPFPGPTHHRRPLPEQFGKRNGARKRFGRLSRAGSSLSSVAWPGRGASAGFCASGRIVLAAQKDGGTPFRSSLPPQDSIWSDPFTAPGVANKSRSARVCIVWEDNLEANGRSGRRGTPVWGGGGNG